VAHLAADLLVGVVGLEQRFEVVLHHRPEHVVAGHRVEVIRGAPLRGERTRLGERHRLEAAELAAAVALTEQQVLLRVWLAHVRGRERVDPEIALWRGLDAQVVERESRRVVYEARAERLVGGVEVQRDGGEAADLGALGELLERAVARARRDRRAASARPRRGGLPGGGTATGEGEWWQHG